MNYTYKQFQKRFPNDNACLDYLFAFQYGDFKCPKCGRKDFYRVKARRSYACSCGYQIYPLANTIFHKSGTSLTNWLFAIYLMSTAKNGVSAKELQRHLGTTYKTAWRIGQKIRSLMKQDDKMLSKTVEVDEFYYGGRKRGHKGFVGKTPVIGMVQRGGHIKAKIVEEVWTPVVLKTIIKNIERGTYLISDDATYYPKTKRLGYLHSSVCHSKKEFVRGKVHTNTIEGAWGNLKRSIYGTYHAVSPKYLQDYVNEFTFSYNARFLKISPFEKLLLAVFGRSGGEAEKSVPCLLRVSS